MSTVKYTVLADPRVDPSVTAAIQRVFDAIAAKDKAAGGGPLLSSFLAAVRSGGTDVADVYTAIYVLRQFSDGLAATIGAGEVGQHLATGIVLLDHLRAALAADPAR